MSLPPKIMVASYNLAHLSLLPWLTLGLLVTTPAIAQTIISDDSTQTIVTPNGDRIDISGGTLSGDGINLFHSFQEFGLTEEQIANFLANPDLKNILGRVTGGNASIIDGLIQVSGGNPNLFLINPAGIIFGANAQLNVPANFTATTATGIAFGGEWFNAFGSNNYAQLTGNPTAFQFDVLQPGAIINRGKLAVSPRQNLSLIAGTVLSSGTLEAPEGDIQVTTVPGSSLIRISQEGQILALEIVAPTNRQGNTVPITPLMLPELLTGSPEPGEIAVSEVHGATATLSASGNLNLIESQLVTSGDLNLLAQGEVIARDSQTQPFLAVAAGNLYIQGNQGIDILALNHLEQTPFISGGDLTLVSDGAISIDAHFFSGGNFSIIQRSGAAADFRSLFDPIISSTEDVIFGSYTGPSLKVESLGSITATGDITITEADLILAEICLETTCSADAQLLADEPALILRSGVDSLQEIALPDTLNLPPGVNIDGTDFNPEGSASSPAEVTVIGEINVGLNLDEEEFEIRTGGTAIITATGDIQTGDINTFADEISSDLGVIGGDVFLETPGNITTGNINSAASSDFFEQSNAGNITINAAGTITTGNLDAFAEATDLEGTATGGTISLNAGELITTGEINTSAIADASMGGAVSLVAGTDPGSNISFSTIDTSAAASNLATDEVTAMGGAVEVTATGVVQGTGVVEGGATIFTGGATASGIVAIQHDGGADNVPFVIGEASENGTAGVINTGESTLDSGSFPVLPNGGDAATTPDGISITSVNTPPGFSALSSLGEVEVGETVTFTLLDLAPEVVTDPNADNTEIVIASIDGGTLNRQADGTPVELGETVSVEETLVFTTTEDTTGEIPAFTLVASDGVSFSTPQEVSINVVETIELTATIPPEEVIEGEIFPQEDELTAPEIDPQLVNNNQPLEIDTAFAQAEEILTNDFIQYLGINLKRTKSLEEGRRILQEIEKDTGIKPGLLYITFTPSIFEATKDNSDKQPDAKAITPKPSDELELVLVTKEGKPVRRRTGVTRSQVEQVLLRFRSTITNARRTSYLVYAQQLYQWLIAPLEIELEAREINNIVFLPDRGFRSLPFAALHDTQGFLIEKYSVGLMPSLSLTDTRYVDIRNSEILAMGAAQFQSQTPLPAVPVELSTIVGSLWRGKFFLNESFTLNNLKNIRANTPYGIVHLATHAEFKPGKPSNSYIQFWENQLQLDQIRQLGLDDERTQLLVLSACRTAVGDAEAELGFAGLAVQAGVKSAMGSLWYVSDEGTLGLMTSFYERLQIEPIKAEALRQAQLDMLQGKTHIESGQLVTPTSTIDLPEQLSNLRARDLSHPYFWSAFTVIGNPW